MRSPEQMSTREVAAHFGVTVRAVHNWIESGRIRPTVNRGPGRGAGHLFDRAAVLAFERPAIRIARELLASVGGAL